MLVVLSPVWFYLLDAKPIPVCKPIRRGRVRLMREDGAFFGKTSAGWFFGFKLHVLTHVSGAVVAAALTPGNGDDRRVAPALCAQTAGGVALGDTGYGGADAFGRVLTEVDMAVVTPRDAEWGSEQQEVLSGVREREETTLRQLWSRFCDRGYARSQEGLWSVSLLKLVHLNLCYAGIASI